MGKIKEAGHIVNYHGQDILESENMALQKSYKQHGCISVYTHSLFVAVMSLFIVRLFHIDCNERSLVRGALLHDYFLYDWHHKEKGYRTHGFTHPKVSLKNAERDFELDDIQRDVIVKHMFPLTPVPPKCREGVIVCLADKICAVIETLSIMFLISAFLKYQLNV